MILIKHKSINHKQLKSLVYKIFKIKDKINNRSNINSISNINRDMCNNLKFLLQTHSNNIMDKHKDNMVLHKSISNRIFMEFNNYNPIPQTPDKVHNSFNNNRVLNHNNKEFSFNKINCTVNNIRLIKSSKLLIHHLKTQKREIRHVINLKQIILIKIKVVKFKR